MGVISGGTAYDILRRAASAAPDTVAVVGTPSGASLTYGQLHAVADAVAADLRSATAIRAGEMIGICLPNSLEFVEAVLAVLASGGVPAYLNWRLSDAEVGGLTVSARLGTVVTTDARRAALSEACTTTRVGALTEGELSFGLELTKDRVETITAPPETALVRFTSGTTGAPKGVAVTRLGWLMRATSLVAAVDHLDRGDTVVAPGPLTHASGLWMIPTMMRLGTLVIMESFGERLLADVCDQYHPSQVSLVPTMFRRLLDAPEAAAALARSRPTIVYGGAPSRRDLLEEVAERFGTRLMHQYGSHELGSITYLSAAEHARGEHLGSVGRPFPGVAVEVGSSPGETQGRVSGWTPWMATGILADGEWRVPDGAFIESGDIGRIDDEGFLWLIDRVEGLLISGGFNVYSTEVESAIGSCPGVADVAVFGVPDVLWGDRITAAVVPTAGSQPSGDEIKAWCRAQLAAYKCPKEIFFYESFPLNSTGKVARRQLAQECAAPSVQGKSEPTLSER